MSSPIQSAVDIQSHLYAAFLEGSTADVAIRVSGSWSAIYRLHRVVLIQSGFFRELFTSGWAEAHTRYGYRRGPEQMDIMFDDPNITRSAFEVCVARLYGGGPPLHISSSMMPTTSRPLTPLFPVPKDAEPIPGGHHPASPRFLLSLLATSVYLSIPHVAQQALSAILGTIGPYTVIRYHSFALGKGIGNAEANVPEPEAAIGLEHVAVFPEEDEEGSIYSRTTVSLTSYKDKGKGKVIDDGRDDIAVKEQTVDNISLAESTLSDDDEPRARELSFHYGPISDKIGEATSCWLARWAVDMLIYEEEKILGKETTTFVGGRRRALTIDSAPSPTIYSKEPEIPYIWRRDGLSAKWVAAIASSDALFVRGEKERYEFAKSVVELRRREGILEEEEKEWTKLFSEGIYYAHMSIEDTIAISQDISPSTGLPYVPLHSLQSAHWDQSMLRHIIVAKPPPSSLLPSGSSLTSPPPARDKVLGLAVTASDIKVKLENLDQYRQRMEGDKLYYQIPGDASLRVGDTVNNSNNSNVTANGGIGMGLGNESAANLSMDTLFNNSATVTTGAESKDKMSRSTKPITSEDTFFGLLPAKCHASDCLTPTSNSTTPTLPSSPSSSTLATSTPTSTTAITTPSWSPYPPIRFGVEFWDLDSLKEKSRLYSHTIWYAGSLYNIYVQIVKKKAQVQLGIYLHRQSNVDPIPPSSAPSVLALKGSFGGWGLGWQQQQDGDKDARSVTDGIHPTNRGRGGSLSDVHTPLSPPRPFVSSRERERPMSPPATRARGPVTEIDRRLDMNQSNSLSSSWSSPSPLASLSSTRSANPSSGSGGNGVANGAPLFRSLTSNAVASASGGPSGFGLGLGSRSNNGSSGNNNHANNGNTIGGGILRSYASQHTLHGNNTANANAPNMVPASPVVGAVNTPHIVGSTATPPGSPIQLSSINGQHQPSFLRPHPASLIPIPTSASIPATSVLPIMPSVVVPLPGAMSTTGSGSSGAAARPFASTSSPPPIITSTPLPSTPTQPHQPLTYVSLPSSQPYRDSRSSVKAYFSITCASATGTSQTRFSSAPDVFAVGQSWGWKSSTLRTEEYVEVGTGLVGSGVGSGEDNSNGGNGVGDNDNANGVNGASMGTGAGTGAGGRRGILVGGGRRRSVQEQEKEEAIRGREVSLRATVVLGLV